LSGGRAGQADHKTTIFRTAIILLRFLRGRKAFRPFGAPSQLACVPGLVFRFPVRYDRYEAAGWLGAALLMSILMPVLRWVSEQAHMIGHVFVSDWPDWMSRFKDY
jgi:hypothetical protein